MPFNRRMDKLWYIHTPEYYTAVKKEPSTDTAKNTDESHKQPGK